MTDEALPIESDTGPWAAVPAWVIDAEISSRAFRLYAILSLYADGGVSGSGGTTRSRKALAARLGCSVDTLDRAVNELQTIGALGRVRKWDGPEERAPNRWIVYRARPGSRANAVGGSREDAAVSTPRPPEEPDPSEALADSVPQTLLDDAPPTSKAAGQGDVVQVVFDHWVSEASKTAATKLDATRRRLILKALKDYPLDEVLDAVRGWKNSPFHTGENPNGQTYNDLGLLLRDATHIERFRDLARGPKLRSGKSAHLPANDRALAEHPDYWGTDEEDS